MIRGEKCGFVSLQQDMTRTGLCATTFSRQTEYMDIIVCGDKR